MEKLGQKPNILVVDDEIGPRESLRIILKPHYQVHVAGDGYQALDILEQHPIDVVTLDLKMPGLPGLEVLKSIKNRDPSIEVVIISGWGSFKSAVEAIRFGVFDYLSKPFNVLDVLSILKKSIERRKINLTFHRFLEEVYPNEQVGDLLLQQVQDKIPSGMMTGSGGADTLNLEFVKVLALTLESKDPYTHGHSGRVTYFSSLLGQKIPLSPPELETLQIASFLHDIGKVGIPNSVINKQGKLSSSETAIVRQHPEKGVFIIESLRVPAEILSIIRHHHERYDGTGYPDGLASDKIPVGARIVAIADAYDAMSSDRPYRPALSAEAIKKEFRRCAGTQFDPSAADLFVQILEEGKK